MTGGWKPYDESEFPKRVVALRLELSEAQLKVDEMLAWLHRGARFKRAAMRALREQGLRFTEWRVLRAMQRLHEELRDAVSQQAVAKRAEMDEGSVSEVMHRLHQRGLADIGFDQWGWAQRIIVTDEGKEALQGAEERLALLHRSAAATERETARSAATERETARSAATERETARSAATERETARSAATERETAR